MSGEPPPAAGAAPQAKRPRGGLARAVLVLAVVLVGLLLAAYLARGLIATALARRTLEDRDFRCEPLALSIDGRLRSVRAEPTRCERARGRVAVVALPEGATLALDGLSPRSLDIAVLELELRDRAALDAMGPGLTAEEVPDPIRRALVALAAFAARPDDPSIRVGELRVARSRGTLVIRELVADRRAGGLDVSVTGIAPDAADEGNQTPIVWRLENVSGRIDAAVATLRGEMVVGLGSEEVRLGMHLHAEGLDGEDPRFEVSFDGSAVLDQLRDRLRGRVPDLGRIGDALRGLREPAAAE